MFVLKRTISQFAANALVKKYMKLKGLNLMNPPTRAIMNFLLELLVFKTLYILTKSIVKTLIAQEVYPQMGFVFHIKLMVELNIMLFL